MGQITQVNLNFYVLLNVINSVLVHLENNFNELENLLSLC